MKLFSVTICAIVAGLVLAVLPAHAHDSRPLYVEIEEFEGGRIALNWKAPPSVDPANRPEVTLGAPCRSLQDNRATRAPEGGGRYSCSGGSSGSRLSIDYPFYNPSLSTLIRVNFFGGETRSALLTPAQNSWVIPAKESFTGVAASYFAIGVRHVLSGFDHLLFLAGLLFIARTPRRVLITITGFTLAHSLTIFLTALDVIRVSVPAVEAVIALSIVFLAVEIARNDRETLAWRRPVFVAGGFGLVHGAGFAAALAEIGLPQTEKIGALLFFNLGVEAGQLAVITGIFTFGFLASKIKPFALATFDAAPLRLIYGYGLGILSALWFVERLAGALA